LEAMRGGNQMVGGFLDDLRAIAVSSQGQKRFAGVP
jgi:hypothetical protein